MSKKTKQGVLDLNHLKGKANKKMPIIPDDIERSINCKHRSIVNHHMSGIQVCKDCGKEWDPYAGHGR